MATRLTRRSLLQGTAGAAFLGASAAVLPLFGTPGSRQTPQSCPSSDLSATEPELIVSNWPLYLDSPDNPDSTLARFERETGIRVRYHDDVNSNQEFFVKVANQLGACLNPGRDLFVSSGTTLPRYIQLGWVQALDHARLPNVTANLLPQLRTRSCDPGCRYSMPWQAGFTGISYNADLVPEVRSYRELLTRDDLRGRVTLLNEMPDTMSAMLRIAGADPQKFDDDDWRKALEVLLAARRRGQIRAFTSQEYVQQLASGNVAASLAWSTASVQVMRLHPNLRFVVPEEGMYFWADSMMIPNKALHRANAERWIDHYYQPEVAARLCAYATGVCPVLGARAAMERLDAEYAANPFLFPPDEILARTFDMMQLDETRNRRYLRDFTQVMGS